MPPLQRGRAQASSSAAARTPTTFELPPYEPPKHPLNASALLQIANLKTQYPTSRLDRQLKAAAETVIQAAGEVNDKLTDKQTAVRRRQAKRARLDQVDSELDDKENADLEQYTTTVGKLTQKLDLAVRKVIDSEAILSYLDTSLTAIHGDAVRNSRAVTAAAANTEPTSSTEPSSTGPPASTMATTVTTVTTSEPTDTQTSIAPKSLPELFDEHMQAKTDAYQTLPPRARYTKHNTYIGFKRMVHDAQHPGDEDSPAPPLPHPSTWFPSAAKSGPAPGMTGSGDATNGDDNEDDDDFAIAAERTSTRCPLTLQEFTDPVTSTKCPHSFERVAIEGLIAGVQPPSTRNARRPAEWVPAVDCPVAGCENKLTLADLQIDPLLVRRIRRLQAARRASTLAPEDGDDDGRDGDTREAAMDVDEVGSESGEDIDAVERRRGAVERERAIKREKIASRQSTQARIDEDDEDEEEDES